MEPKIILRNRTKELKKNLNLRVFEFLFEMSYSDSNDKEVYL